MKSVKMIKTEKDLGILVNTLKDEPLISVDTESNSLYAYQERVCLIQFSIPGEDFIVDTLALKDLSPLAEIFASDTNEMIFHAAEYDLLCLKRDFNFSFCNLFDTMVAARACGRDLLGLGNLLESEFGVKADKKYQRADWGKRPLTEEMIAYASMDTHYLIPLRTKLIKELNGGEFWELAQEDFERMCKVDGNLPIPQEPDVWKVMGKENLSKQQQAILHELIHYREGKAQQYDLPVFKVIGNKTLLEIALINPGKLEELDGINGLSPKLITRHGKNLLKAVERGRRLPAPVKPKQKKPDFEYLDRIDRLKAWRRDTGKEKNVASDVILPRTLMEKIGKENPRTLDELELVMLDAPVRFKMFGTVLLSALKEN
ncbi:MAG: ribonuclease D [Anaerolineales bacterium]|nr:ribonuclease D [Anaerolineales bacterium]